MMGKYFIAVGAFAFYGAFVYDSHVLVFEVSGEGLFWALGDFVYDFLSSNFLLCLRILIIA